MDNGFPSCVSGDDVEPADHLWDPVVRAPYRGDPHRDAGHAAAAGQPGGGDQGGWSRSCSHSGSVMGS